MLYYCIALNHVFLWLLHPKAGIVQFKRVDITDLSLSNTSDNASIFSENSSTYVQPLIDSIAALREALGIDARRQFNKSANSSIISDDSSEDTESVISIGDTLSSSPATSNSRSPTRGINMQPIHELYELLIHPIECALPHPSPGSPYRGQVIIVPDKDLYTVPFSLLKSEGSRELLYQQFHIRYAPSLQTLITEKKKSNNKKKSVSNIRLKVTSSDTPISSTNNTGTPEKKPLGPIKPIHLVVGNPAIPISVSQSPWQSMNGVEKEIKLVSDLLETKPLTGSHATKQNVMKRMIEAESIYFVTNISWNQSSIVLAMSDDIIETHNEDSLGTKSLPRRLSSDGPVATRRYLGDGSSDNNMESSDYILSLMDIMESKLKAKLVVISASHKSENNSRLTAEGLMVMAEGLLASGAESVLIPLWPTSLQGSRLMMNAFFSSLLYGSRASRALAYAMQVCANYYMLLLLLLLLLDC